MNHERSRRRSTWRTIALILCFMCAAWLVVVGVLWQLTGTVAPTVNVRWVPNITNVQRAEAERQLSLVEHEARRGTFNYFLLNTEQENLKRIVLNPLVEDTAYISRGSFVLEDPPYARMWFGDRNKMLGSPGLLVAIGVVCLTAAAFGFGGSSRIGSR